MLESSKIFIIGSNVTISQSITCLGKAFMIAFFAVNLTQELKNFYATASQWIIKLSQRSKLDQYARACLYYTRYRDSQEGDVFATKCISLYCTNSFFYSMRGISYYYSRRFNQARVDFEKAVSINPENSHYRFQMACVAMERSLNWAPTDRIQVLEEFLMVAEKDNWYRSKSYYWIGEIYLEEKNIKKAQQYYLLGLASENDQLCFFMPCESSSKRILESSFPGVFRVR